MVLVSHTWGRNRQRDILQISWVDIHTHILDKIPAVLVLCTVEAEDILVVGAGQPLKLVCRRTDVPEDRKTRGRILDRGPLFATG